HLGGTGAGPLATVRAHPSPDALLATRGAMGGEVRKTLTARRGRGISGQEGKSQGRVSGADLSGQRPFILTRPRRKHGMTFLPTATPRSFRRSRVRGARPEAVRQTRPPRREGGVARVVRLGIGGGTPGREERVGVRARAAGR